MFTTCVSKAAQFSRSQTHGTVGSKLDSQRMKTVSGNRQYFVALKESIL
jgi:hypothetical protein